MPSVSQSTSIPETVELQRRGNTLTATGSITDKPVTCLIDTGAVTTIREDFVANANLGLMLFGSRNPTTLRISSLNDVFATTSTTARY